MNIVRISNEIASRNGRITSQNDEGTVVRIRFPWVNKAGGFYDVMVSAGVKAEWSFQINPTDVVIYL